MLLADLHTHSTFSDGQMTIPELVDFYGTRGFDVIAITDHVCERKSVIGKAANYINYSLNPATAEIYFEILKSEAERAMEKYKMLVIPGVEITKNSFLYSRSAHILALGITQFISADPDVETILKQIRSLGGFSVAAHPVSTRRIESQTYYLWDRREKLSSLMDAWEVASGPVLFDEVQECPYPKIATSDLHHPRQINSWKTLLDAEKNIESIFQSIRQQKVRFTFYQEAYDIRTQLSHGSDLRSEYFDLVGESHSIASRNV